MRRPRSHFNVVTIEQADGVIRVRGDLTFKSVPGLVARTPDFKGGAAGLTVDLAGVRKADSAGLAFLLGWIRRAKQAGSELHFSGIPRQLSSLVRVTGLGSLFQLSD